MHICTAHRQHFSLSAASRFSCSRLRGTQGARMCSTTQAWGLVGLRGACSGRSKSSRAVSFSGIAFRRARANQAHGNLRSVFCCCSFALCCCVPHQSSNAVRYALTQPRYNSSRASTYSRCGKLVCLSVCSTEGSHSNHYRNSNTKCGEISASFIWPCCLLVPCMYHPVLQALYTMSQPH